MHSSRQSSRFQLEHLEGRRLLSCSLAAPFATVEPGDRASQSAPVFAGPVAPVQVPFRGSLDGVVTHEPVGPQTDSVLVEATGIATHLGRFTLTAPHLVNTTTRTAAGTYEFTAANGDKIYAEFTGQASPTATPGVISIVETATITGGTGRFEGATGGFVVQRLYDRIAGTTTGSFEGTISAPGAGAP